MMPPLSVSAPAKVNLHLRVVGRRRDGFHEVQTLMTSVNLADEIRGKAVAGRRISLRIEPPGSVDGGSDNTVIRAADLLRQRSGVERGAEIVLRKRIPVAAGLGGGSADAAATLVLLNELWQTDLGPDDLMGLARRLGSDVPFFLCGGFAAAVGRGVEVHPLPDIDAIQILVCVPPCTVSTAEAFARMNSGLISELHDDKVTAFVAQAARDASNGLPWDTLTNDLEEIVRRSWPVVGEAIDALRSTGANHVALTGTGSASFGVFEDRRTAEAAAHELRSRWRVFQLEPVGRDRARLVVRR